MFHPLVIEKDISRSDKGKTKEQMERLNLVTGSTTCPLKEMK